MIGVSIEYNVTRRTRPHPQVRLLGDRPTTCMAAKFRSLSRAPIEMWYDDGRDGILSATLRLGQETTTNTYEGHEFYFTEKFGKKDVEIARFKMKNSQVGHPFVLSDMM